MRARVEKILWFNHYKSSLGPTLRFKPLRIVVPTYFFIRGLFGSCNWWISFDHELLFMSSIQTNMPLKGKFYLDGVLPIIIFDHPISVFFLFWQNGEFHWSRNQWEQKSQQKFSQRPKETNQNEPSLQKLEITISPLVIDPQSSTVCIFYCDLTPNKMMVW